MHNVCCHTFIQVNNTDYRATVWRTCQISLHLSPKIHTNVSHIIRRISSEEPPELRHDDSLNPHLLYQQAPWQLGATPDVAMVASDDTGQGISQDSQPEDSGTLLDNSPMPQRFFTAMQPPQDWGDNIDAFNKFGRHHHHAAQPRQRRRPAVAGVA